MFKHEVAHAKCTWYQAILDHRMMINFVVVLSDLWLSDLGTQLKKEAELSELITTWWWVQVRLPKQVVYVN